MSLQVTMRKNPAGRVTWGALKHPTQPPHSPGAGMLMENASLPCQASGEGKPARKVSVVNLFPG